MIGKLAEVQEDYNALAASFEKSEKLRRKQKELIEKLRAELGKGGSLQQAQTRRAAGRSKSAKSDKKQRSTSRKTVKFRK